MYTVKAVTVCLSLIFVMFVARSDAAIDPASVIGIWLFDEEKGETAADSSKNANDGAINGEVERVEGKFGTALKFETEEDYVEVPPSALYSSETFTFSFWFFPHAIGGNNPAGKGNSTLIFANGNPGDGGGSNWWFEHWNNANLNFFTCVGGCGGTNTPINTPNKWYFVTGIYNGAEYELYIDGEFKSKGAHVKGDLEKGLMMANALCPAGHGCDGGYYKGLLDDVAMFNGVLELDDIVDLMDKGVAKVLGISAAVSPTDKLATRWARIKAE